MAKDTNGNEVKSNVLFTVGRNGNGTVHYNKTSDEIHKMVKDYENRGWIVSFVQFNRDSNTVWYAID